MIKPTPKQIENCEAMGWEYQGDGLFFHVKRDLMGWFTKDGWTTE